MNKVAEQQMTKCVVEKLCTLFISQQLEKWHKVFFNGQTTIILAF